MTLCVSILVENLAIWKIGGDILALQESDQLIPPSQAIVLGLAHGQRVCKTCSYASFDGRGSASFDTLFMIIPSRQHCKENKAIAIEFLRFLQIPTGKKSSDLLLF